MLIPLPAFYCTVPSNFANMPNSPVSTVEGLSPRHHESKNTDGSTNGKPEIGVYTLRVEQESDATEIYNRIMRDRQLAEIQDACLHNSRVCDALLETGKSQTWNLLAKAIESGYSASRAADDGWCCGSGGGGRRGALTYELVGNILRYYESLGDVQMLATIVCLLRPIATRASSKWNKENIHTSPSSNQKGKWTWTLLPKGQDGKYDTYIRRYADLLYSWGLLTTRAELNKHLLLRLSATAKSETGGLGRTSLDDNVPAVGTGSAFGGGQQQDANNINEDKSSASGGDREGGIAFTFTCPICSTDTAPGENFCRTCQDYAFRCTICDTAVRGLFTACEL